MKISKHGKLRIIERAGISTNQMQFYRNAIRNGIDPRNMEEGKIRNYLMKKMHYCKVKLYKGYVFIYSKNGKQLYTMYKLPKDLGSEEDGTN